MKSLTEQVKQAKKASIKLASSGEKTKNKSLNYLIGLIKENKNKIIKENKKDMEKAKKDKLSRSLIKRLILDNKKIYEILEIIESVIKLEDPIGKIIEKTELDKKLILEKITVPIGLIGAIFESRPDATVQIASLCIKSGNAVILKGGSEAANTNKILVKLIQESLKKAHISDKAVQLIETREEVKEILKLDDKIDLLIPRGSNKFVKYIQENTKIPVLGHSEGICHVYVDKDADIDKAIPICYDAKCQYAAVCNAMETLLVHTDMAKKFLPLMRNKYEKANVELRGDEETLKIIKIKKVSEMDWKTEYNDIILSIKVVNNADEAINHINKYGSKHTDAIITNNHQTAKKFLSLVDSSSVMHNCSTRFADGFRYGKGAEVGISTGKIHARGPVGLEGLTIYKYLVKGNGQIVNDYVSGKKKLTHKKLK
jgi:glutamate-5-semialdehyde dehydrogenase